MREGGVGERGPALRHQRRQVSHQQGDQEHRITTECCEGFTVKLTPRFEVSVVVYCKIIADYNES